MTDRQLYEAARRAAQNAWAPYSGFRVGAALEAADGTVYTGANIENASYGATVCAERTALYRAVLDGQRQFTRLAVAAVNAEGQTASAPPCGICRQSLAEFSDGRLLVVFGTADTLHRTQLADLFPYAFELEL